MSIDSSNNTISDNFIGTDPLGTLDRGNAGNGIAVSPGANSNRIKNNLVSGNNATGILLQGDSNKVQGNKVGTNSAGTGAIGNSLAGVWMYFGSSNFVGVDGDNIGDATEGNLISGNGTVGVNFQGNSDNNVIAGNLIGTNAAGTGAIGNSSGGITFFNDFQGDNNRIGTDANGTSDELERNIVSGNLNYGIVDFGVGTKIAGNYVGTKIDGLSALANSQGGVSLGSSGAIVGGTSAASRNVVSGNAGFGVAISNATGTLNTVLGNFIGVDVTGNGLLPNTNSGVIIQSGAHDNTIGGSTASARNIISGNSQYGVSISDGGTNDNVISGNYIGTDAAGTAALANGNVGIQIQNDAMGTVVGGFTDIPGTGAGNVIGGNGAFGIQVSGAANNTFIRGNVIGLGSDGVTDLGSNNGIQIISTTVNPTSPIVVGGDDDDDGILDGNVRSRNVISGLNLGISNAAFGTNIGTRIQGNYVGTNRAGTNSVGNNIGISVSDAPGTIIGGSAAGAGNVISGSAVIGLYLLDPNGNNTVQGNLIGTNALGTSALGNAIGLQIENAGNTIGGTTAS